MLNSDLEKFGFKNPFRLKYENFIGGKWVPPVDGKYFENISFGIKSKLANSK